MSTDHRIPTLVASALIGLIAAASLVTGALMFFGAWATSTQTIGPVSDIGTAAALLIGGLTVVFGAFAAYAARETWRGRPHGTILGLIAGAVTVLAAVAALLEATVTQGELLLYIAVGLGIATMAAALLDAVGRPAEEQFAHIGSR
jgi:hypothetical protein